MNELLNGLLGGSMGLGGSMQAQQQSMQQQMQAMQGIGLLQAQLQFYGAAQAAIQPPPKSAEQIQAEEARSQCAAQMITNPKVRHLIENAMPIEWCRRLYPEVYRVR